MVSDINGVSARRILAAIARGNCDPQSLANLAVGSLQHKHQELERALSGRVREHHRFLIATHLTIVRTVFDKKATHPLGCK